MRNMSVSVATRTQKNPKIKESAGSERAIAMVTPGTQKQTHTPWLGGTCCMDHETNSSCFTTKSGKKVHVRVNTMLNVPDDLLTALCLNAAHNKHHGSIFHIDASARLLLTRGAMATR